VARRRNHRLNKGPIHFECPSIVPSGRELYLLDPESWAVTEGHGPLRRGVGRLFEAVCAPTALDAVYVGVDPRRSFDAKVEFPRCHLRVGDGPSGGERAVIGAVDLAHAAGRFGGVTIGSGDHAFLAVAAEAVRRGLRVRVVSWVNRLSRDLSAAAHEVVLLDNFLSGGPHAITERARCWRGACDLPGGFVEAA